MTRSDSPACLAQAEIDLANALLPLGLSYVGVVLAIYNENDGFDLKALLTTVLDQVPADISETQREALVAALQNAWNYFPHARHDGLSPAQIMASLLP
jgi:hypothetical protein